MSKVYAGRSWTIDCFVSGFSNNAFLITCLATNNSLIIDTPSDPRELISAAQSTKVDAVFITHNHWDHIDGMSEVLAVLGPVPVRIGIKDAEFALKNEQIALEPLHTNTTISIGSIEVRTISTPGHTPGSTCFLLPAESPRHPPHLFSGDTLFPGGPGRTRSHQALLQIITSIGNELMVLPESTVVLPGHGQFTNIRDAKTEYIEFLKTPLTGNEFGDISWRR